MAQPILYSYYQSSCSWRARLGLRWKGIDYEYKAINLLKGEQKLPHFTAINPLQTVPVLRVDGKNICQSVAILEFLEEKYPHRPLLPNDLYEKAIVRQLVQSIVADIQPVQNLRVLQKLPEDQRRTWGNYWIENGFKGKLISSLFERFFQAIEKTLSFTAGKYCVGDTVTMADLCLVPQINNAKRFKVDMLQFPIISRINDTLDKLPEFQDTHPSKQPDAPDSS